MNIKSVGIDLEEVSRFIEIPFNENKKFYKKIFTQNEINYCLKKSNPYMHFTGIFCSKEATIKALNNPSIPLIDIEVMHINNKPKLNIPGNYNSIISITHTEKIANAVVIIVD